LSIAQEHPVRRREWFGDQRLLDEPPGRHDPLRWFATPDHLEGAAAEPLSLLEDCAQRSRCQRRVGRRY
jgi:hypothetical protein